MEYTITPGTSVTVAVVQAVSSFENTNPTDLPPLREVLDPDALDALFATDGDGSSDRDGEISFVFSDSHVTVANGEQVTVKPKKTTSVTA